jgi:hypothetical protein
LERPKNIRVNKGFYFAIDFEDLQDSTTRIELDRDAAEELFRELGYALKPESSPAVSYYTDGSPQRDDAR